jgi:hypothetical protein
MVRVNYRALLEAGEIKTVGDLVARFRQEMIAIYQSKGWWPRYTPGSGDLLILRWYREARLEDIMDFGTFCLVWKEMELLKGPGESTVGGSDFPDVSF